MNSILIINTLRHSNLKIISIILAVLIVGGGIFVKYYFFSTPTEPTNEIWTPHIGRDTTVGILPDEFANYYSYTFIRPSNDIGLRIKGKFPSTRYMSFNVYDIRNKTTQGSIIDYQIESDSGKPNPFEPNPTGLDTGKDYTVHVIPNKYVKSDLNNSLGFENDIRTLLVVIRLYDFNIDDFGGVDFPTVQAIKLNENEFEPTHLPRPLDLRSIVRKRSLLSMVKRLGKLYETEKNAPLDASKSSQHKTIPFHAVDKRGYIENNDNQYLMAAITKQANEVYLFKIKAPTYTTGPENINQTEVRYWSFNLGNSATYNFNGLKDEDILLDENGFANIVLASSDHDIEERSKDLGFNFMEWNMPHKKGLILVRHMLANPDFSVQITDVPIFDTIDVDFTPVEAQNYIGDYSPQGLRMSKQEFLGEYNVPIKIQVEDGI